MFQFSGLERTPPSQGDKLIFFPMSNLLHQYQSVIYEATAIISLKLPQKSSFISEAVRGEIGSAKCLGDREERMNGHGKVGVTPR